MRKILFATEFESLAFPCLELLFSLRPAGLEEIDFLYVIDRDEVGFVPYGGFDRELSEELRQTAALHFEDWGKQVEAAALRYRVFEELGRPSAKILEVAAREGVDLIATARPHHHAGDGVYPRGTALELLRESTLPVLVCKGEGAECAIDVPSGFGHLLYATDFGEDGGPALTLLGALKDVVRRVSVVHVMPPRELREIANEEVDKQRLEMLCQELRKRGLEADSHLLVGDVLDEVLRKASDCRCAAIVMTTRRRSGLGELLHGSLSHRVAIASPIPVFLVPCDSN